MAEHGNLTLLSRVQRLRVVERRKALAVLADARAEDARMTDLARRSGAIAAEYALLGGTADASDLVTRAHFGNQMAALASSAETMGQHARAAADVAGDRYARTERNLEDAADRLRQAQSHINAKAQQRAASVAPGLARRLHCDREHDDRHHADHTATHQTGEHR